MGYGQGPSAQTVPPRTLKQQLQMEKSRDVKKSLLKASGNKKNTVSGVSVLAVTLWSVVSRVRSSSHGDLTVQFCGWGLSAVLALVLAPQFCRLSSHCGGCPVFFQHVSSLLVTVSQFSLPALPRTRRQKSRITRVSILHNPLPIISLKRKGRGMGESNFMIKSRI